jgi:hypothetical protein
MYGPTAKHKTNPDQRAGRTETLRLNFLAIPPLADL